MLDKYLNRLTSYMRHRGGRVLDTSVGVVSAPRLSVGTRPRHAAGSSAESIADALQTSAGRCCSLVYTPLVYCPPLQPVSTVSAARTAL